MSQQIILLHGALGSEKQMQPLAELLNHNTICFDFPGHGALSSETGPFSIERMGKVVLKLIDGPTDLIGYSMGGYVALYLAAEHPEHIRSVTTLATKFDWTPEGAQQEVRMLDAEKVKAKAPAFAKLLEDRHGTHWPEVMGRTADLMLQLGNRPVLTESVLRRIHCPVLLMRGSGDNMVTKEETLWAKGFIPSSTYRELKGQPHPLEKMNLDMVSGIFNL